jgi:caa(3)-type oxidase subunit IV
MPENRENHGNTHDSAVHTTKKESGYNLYIFTFVCLSVLTLIAVALTQIRMSPAVTVGLVLLIATIQATIVLFYNMHLKFHDKVLIIFVGIIFTLIFLTIIITLVDYIYR